MSKQTTKRKITVEVASKTSEPPKSRPSVFERLGTKTITTTSSQSNGNEYCRHWSQNGTCPYGKSCKYASTHTLTSPSKRAATKKDEQKKQNRTSTTTPAGAIGSGAGGKDEPNKRLHSTIVKALRSPEPADWEQWNQTDLEDADAEMLEKRRQELQRELELQMKMDSKQTKGKEKTASSAKKGSSSSSSNSSSSSTESSSSSEETSSTSSSTSLDSRSRKVKRTKPKRDSSSSTEPERRKKKPTSTSKSGHKHSTNIKITEKKKTSTSSPALKHGTATKAIKSPSLNRRLSQTPPLKSSKIVASSKNKPNSRSPRSQSQSHSQSQSQSQTDRSKEKHRTPSPKLSTACARDRDRERDRERVKEKERAREKEREKTREKERERERERERDKEKIREKEKSREREKGRERDREREPNVKSNSSRSPKRANSRQSRDLSKKKESPTGTGTATDTRNKVAGDGLKSRSTNTSNSNNSGGTNNTTSGSAKRDSSAAINKNSPVTSSKDLKDKEKEDRRLDRNRDEDTNKKKDDRERRERDRDRDRDVKDRSLERRKDKDKEKEKEKDKEKRVERDDVSRDRRERERERRMTREEREAAREKEREEALARCQERQRERERLKELAKKERESIPSLLHINTGAATSVNRLRGERDRERDRDRDRGLDKPPADRVERLLPLPADRIPPMRKELERQAARSQDRTSNRSNDRPERNRSTNRGSGGGGGVREPNFEYRESRERDRDRDRDRERDRDFPALGARAPREERRHDEKNYESPYRPSSYMGLEHEHYENAREREFPEERRGGRRDTWDARDIEPELVLDEERRRGYGREQREEGRASSTMKERAWDNPDYMNRAEWERNRRPEWAEDWDPAEHNSMEEEWRHYNRSMDSWPSDDRRRWPLEFPERRPGPTSTTSHLDADEHLEVTIPVVDDVKKETILGKRIAETVEDIPEVKLKKICIVIEDSTILEDALSEISDDADEILNREDVEELHYSDNNNVNQFETNVNIVVQHLHKSDDDFEPIVEQSKDASGEEVSKHGVSAAASASTVDELEVKAESPVHEYEDKQQQQQQRPQQQQLLLQQEQEPDNLEESGIDEDGIDNMDFEEISDEELEEEVKVKGLGDALGVDWASLVSECRPRPKPDKAGGAKKRWHYCNVLARIGVSLEMAGVQVVQDMLGETNTSANTDANTDPNKRNAASIAAIQVAGHENTLVRNNLFASAGPFRRALSARRDLAIRRHLCSLPMFTFERSRAPPPDPLFYKNVLNTITIK